MMSRGNCLFCLVAAVLCMASAGFAIGGISSISGSIEIIKPPTSVRLSATESNLTAKLFTERESAYLSSPIELDVTQPGTVVSTDDLTADVLPVSAVPVNSYFLHADPIRSGMPPIDYSGSVTFEEEILGVMVSYLSLTLSDDLLGAQGTEYPSYAIYRGFEGLGFPAHGSDINDTLTLSPDRRTVKFQLMTTSQFDQIRFVTLAGGSGSDKSQNVPEPPAVLLAVVGLCLAAASRC